MGKNGKLLNLNSDSPKYGNKSLVTKEQENELKRRKITFSFSYFKQIPNFQIGECSKGWHIGLLERLGALGTMTPQEVLEENRGSIALRCHPIDWSAKNIPIQRKDLDWLPKEILDNETDFPIMQFSITETIQNAISKLKTCSYFDANIAKDNVKYTLYVNYHKVASGYKAFIENFPNDIQTVIKEMLLLASPLYYKNHKS